MVMLLLQPEGDRRIGKHEMCQDLGARNVVHDEDETAAPVLVWPRRR